MTNRRQRAKPAPKPESREATREESKAAAEKAPTPPPEFVVLDAAAAASEFRLPVEDAAVIVGSGVRVSSAWLSEFRTRTQMDFTIADCALLTGAAAHSFHKWRQCGLLKVRAVSKGLRDKLLVAPAELVRVLRKIAAERNGTTVLDETPSQTARRGESDRSALLAACRGET